MNIVTATAFMLFMVSSLANETGNELDRKIIRLLVADAEVVAHVHRDAGGFVGIDEATRSKYGLVGPVQIACRMQLKDTLIGPKLEGDTVEFLFSRSPGNERCFLAEGDYLLFLKRGQARRWVLVADYLGMQPWTPGLENLVTAGVGK